MGSKRPSFATGYNEEFLNYWYFGGGSSAIGAMSGAGSELKKAGFDATYEFDYPSAFGTYGEPVFDPKVEIWLSTSTEVFKILPKTTFVQKGDSMKYIETRLASLRNITTLTDTPITSIAAEAAETIVDIDQIKPAYYIDAWKINWISRVETSWQKAMKPNTDPAFIKSRHAENLPHLIDEYLTLDVDNAFGARTLQSLDVIFSMQAETTGSYVSATTDPDLYFGKASAEVTRASDTDDTFGCGAGEADSAMIGAGTNARVLQLDFIDDALAAAKKYSKNKRYIMLTGNKTINEMNKLIDPKQRFLDVKFDYQQTLSGISTRKGVVGGFSVAALITNGLVVPVFGCDHVAGESSSNESATITDGDVGNIYIIDLDAIELRVAVPVTYLETAPNNMLNVDYLQSIHAFMWGAQLIPTNPRALATVKYLKAS